MKVLIVGSGGRESCLVWKVKQSPLVDEIYIAPGNAGTALLGRNLDIKADDLQSLLGFAKTEKVDLTVVGPEIPLVAGIVDLFEQEGLKVFGPRKDLARLEGSKVFAKELMKKYGVPTADFKVFSKASEAKDYIRKKEAPLVVKADGLAAGKGVVVCKTSDEAFAAVDLIMVEKQFGSSGEKIVIEDCLEGQEASILVFSDGETIVPLVSSQDHKRVFDSDQGPNTGGMGAYSPAPIVNKDVFDKIITEVFKPLIFGLKKEQKIFKGILYAGLMIKDNQMNVLEFNVRFGDPETQAVLPKLKTDLVEVILAIVGGRLSTVNLEWDERFCVCVVLASGGYPGSYRKGKAISGLESLRNCRDIFIFHAGTKQDSQGNFLTDGGRVLNVVGLADTIEETQAKVYKAIENISFENMHYRKDIANKALKFLAR
ncbi:MAG: phosphoribosylamine--glycine ligase [Candidatus Omnitrophica bacterium]|nr:phosphoribosylamine--glycine ligase [Candidatus Omnitrophota bacterium]